MAGQGTFRAVAALTAALAGVPAMAQQSLGVADFLTTIGGDTHVKTSGSLRTRPRPTPSTVRVPGNASLPPRSMRPRVEDGRPWSSLEPQAPEAGR